VFVLRFVTYLITLIVGFIVQSTFFESITILDIKPNAVLIIIVSIALLRGELEGAIVGFLGGLLLDIYSPYVGINAFIGMITGYIVGILTAGLYKENPFVPVTTVFIATLFYDFMFYVLGALMQGYTDFSYFFNTIILREMVYNAIIALIVYGIIYFINSKLELKERFKKKLF
jgi:rod shape-determining protein MreD